MVEITELAIPEGDSYDGPDMYINLIVEKIDFEPWSWEHYNIEAEKHEQKTIVVKELFVKKWKTEIEDLMSEFYQLSRSDSLDLLAEKKNILIGLFTGGFCNGSLTVHGCLPKVNEKTPKYILIDEFKSGELIMYDLVRPQSKETHEKLCDLVNTLNNKKLAVLHKNKICVKNCNLCLPKKEVKTEMIKSIKSKTLKFESKTNQKSKSKYDSEYIDYHSQKLESVRKGKRKRKGSSDNLPKSTKKQKKSSVTSTVIEDSSRLQNISTTKSENSVIVKSEPLSYGEFTVAKQEYK